MAAMTGDKRLRRFTVLSPNTESIEEAPPMTEYADFIRDFPAVAGRCLNFATSTPSATAVKVTLLITTAAAAFVPYE
jgi:hypothetical protein